MRYDEYQQRRRALEDQLETDLELIRAGHRAKLQALEMLWLASAERVAAAPASPEPQKMPPPETQTWMETQPSTETPVETQPARSRRIPSVEDEVEALLPRLPDEGLQPIDAGGIELRVVAVRGALNIRRGPRRAPSALSHAHH